MDDLKLFTHEMNVRTLPRKGHHTSYLASQEVCSAIAQHLNVMRVVHFEGKAVLSPWKKNGVQIIGSIRADVILPCAVSGEPLESQVDESFDVLYVPEGSPLSKPKMNDEGELIFDPYGDDLPESFSGDTIDLANIWIEFFILGLDFFARKPGKEMHDAFAPKGESRDAWAESPFAALVALKNKV